MRCKCSAPCQYICPISTKIPTYVSLINRKRFKDAWDIIKLDNPLPSACARVCHHPCQTKCEAGKWDAPFPSECSSEWPPITPWKTGFSNPPGRKGRPTGERVGIIGAGPSGLAAANDLAKKGFRVTIFERLEEAGGAVAACHSGIPHAQRDPSGWTSKTSSTRAWT